MTVPIALTIAGSDSGGGAGIQADLKTFTALRVYGASVITSLTAQNTLGVEAISDVPPEFVLAQMKAVLSDLGADAIKTGMLSTSAIVEAVAEGLTQFAEGIPLVVDPVMVSKSGHQLLREDAIASLVKDLLPLTAILTPNTFEAEMLTNIHLASDDDAMAVADALLAMGPKAILLKGGHRQSPDCSDLYADQTGKRQWLFGERLDERHTHGTGCTLSSAITAFLACGIAPLEACRQGKEFIEGAIRHSFPIGNGTGPVNHLWQSGGFRNRAG